MSLRNGVIAAWSFAFTHIGPEMDRLIRRLHDEIVDPFWIEPNRIVERGYRDLHFAFEPIHAPSFEMISQMDLAGAEGYMRTWSACVKYRAKHGTDSVDLIHAELLAAWGDPSMKRDVRWQLNLRVGRV